MNDLKFPGGNSFYPNCDEDCNHCNLYDKCEHYKQQEAKVKKTICPICKNERGFASAVCIECGYNHLSNEFSRIVVMMEDIKYLLSDEVLHYLIQKHRRYKERK